MRKIPSFILIWLSELCANLLWIDYLKTYDAVVGDVTILAARSRKVEFTQPYAESGLVTVVQARSKEPHKTWLFMNPFTIDMWVLTAALLIYTMIIVWVVENQSNNPAFRGPWNSQLGTAFSFTFSSLFFAHSKYKYSKHKEYDCLMNNWVTHTASPCCFISQRRRFVATLLE